MFDLLENRPQRRSFGHELAVCAGAAAALYVFSSFYQCLLPELSEFKARREPTAAERRAESLERVENICFNIAKPEAFEFIGRTTSYDDADDATVVFRYRTARPAAEIRAFFLATLRRPKFRAASDLIASKLIDVRRVDTSQGDEYEITCRPPEREITFGIFG